MQKILLASLPNRLTASLFLLLTFYMADLSFGQSCSNSSNILFNGGFEDVGTCNITNVVNDAFTIGCAMPWQPASFTPSLCSFVNVGGGVIVWPPEGNVFACLASATNSMGACTLNESIMQPVALCQNVQYKLSFLYNNLAGHNGTIKVFLTHGLQSGGNCISPQGQLIADIAGTLGNTGWTAFSTLFTLNDLADNHCDSGR